MKLMIKVLIIHHFYDFILSNYLSSYSLLRFLWFNTMHCSLQMEMQNTSTIAQSYTTARSEASKMYICFFITRYVFWYSTSFWLTFLALPILQSVHSKKNIKSPKLRHVAEVNILSPSELLKSPNCENSPNLVTLWGTTFFVTNDKVSNGVVREVGKRPPEDVTEF